MVQIDTKFQNKKKTLLHNPYTYQEVIQYLDTHWKSTTNLQAIAQLNEIFEHPAKNMDVAIVSGTSGKSTTIDYTCKLLQEEGLKVGAFYTPHFISYNERFAVNNEHISNKTFTDLANLVIAQVQDKEIQASTKDILTIMALLFFKQCNVDFVMLENASTYTLDPVLYFEPKIIAVTRIVANTHQDDTPAAFENIIKPMTSSSFFVAADQNKQNLQIMQQLVQAKGGNWSMPIRKLAPLPYPYEQLHGRCAALAERIASIYTNHFFCKNTKNVIVASLLNKPKGSRGRPTLEAKKMAEMHPKQSIEAFWNDVTTPLASRFQLVPDTKPAILLDNADNLDALSNTFLGYRLLAYKQSFKSTSVIMGCYQDQFEDEAFIKQIRYFVKKCGISLALCPIQPTAGEYNKPSWDTQKIAHLAKAAKIKLKTYKNFSDAFTAVKHNHEDRNHLVIITGSQAIVTEYLKLQA